MKNLLEAHVKVPFLVIALLLMVPMFLLLAISGENHLDLNKKNITTEMVMVDTEENTLEEPSNTEESSKDDSMETDEGPVVEEVKKEYTQAELEEIFDLKNKVEGTKIFYSENLGIGFTYLPSDPYNNMYSNYSVKESGNILTVGDDDTIEVLQKDTNLTLLQTVEKDFLSGADPKKCLAKQNNEFFKTVYIEATQFGRTEKEIEDNPYLASEINCPNSAKSYALAGGASFFFDSSDKSKTKYFFIELGQDGSALAGFKNKDDAGFNISFYQSIEFVENFDKILSEK